MFIHYYHHQTFIKSNHSNHHNNACNNIQNGTKIQRPINSQHEHYHPTNNNNLRLLLIAWLGTTTQKRKIATMFGYGQFNAILNLEKNREKKESKQAYRRLEEHQVRFGSLRTSTRLTILFIQELNTIEKRSRKLLSGSQNYPPPAI